MDNFEKWLHSPSKDHPIKISADAHYKLVSIHPFVDGNGRTARLLMNLLLMQKGYPPAIIKKEERRKYINSLEKAQTGGNLNDYYKLIYRAVDYSLNIYLESIEVKKTKKNQRNNLLKIGDLAKQTEETIYTIRFWTKEGLLTVKDFTKGGYQLYEPLMIKKAKEIRRLQNQKRLTIAEIKKKL